MSDGLRETLPPDTLVDGRYRILTRIGSGGMADVYCAEDTQLGRRIALKTLHRRFAEDEEFIERFRREASAAAGLQHPNVVAVFDRGEWEGTWYIAMELLEGRSLKQLVVDEGPLDPARAVDITLQILRAARFAHKRGIIHRDIKPHNVILDSEGRVKVTDFGIARAGASDMTETGAILGTAQYLSPEQAQGHPVSAAADLYSVGIVLYELLTGRVPFEAEAAVTIALKQVSEDPAPPRTLNPDVSPELEAVVLRALRKDPGERFADADEFIAALEAARDLPARPEAAQLTGRLTGIYPAAMVEQYAPIAEPPWGVPPEEPGRGSRLWWILAVLLALALLGIGAYLLLRPELVTVPNVVRLTEESAAARLNNAGFEVRIERVRSADVPEGRVTRQRPNPGTEAEAGSTVSLFVSDGPGERAVPDVVGERLAAAERTMRRAGFDTEVDREFSDTVRAGRVIESQPPPRVQYEIGETVTLVVSRGRERVEVPDVRDLERDEATRRLEALELSVSVNETETEEEEPGEVLSQDPDPGTEVEEGSTVTITVAQEPSEVRVPRVEGDDVNAAIRKLQDAGFQVRQEEELVDDLEDDGRVVDQRPNAGSRRPRGSTVTIFVGRFDDSGLDPDPGAGDPTPTPTPAPTP